MVNKREALTPEFWNDDDKSGVVLCGVYRTPCLGGVFRLAMIPADE